MKKILIVDANFEKTNDRTWCFWDEKQSFDEIVSKKRDVALFADK